MLSVPKAWQRQLHHQSPKEPLPTQHAVDSTCYRVLMDVSRRMVEPDEWDIIGLQDLRRIQRLLNPPLPNRLLCDVIANAKMAVEHGKVSWTWEPATDVAAPPGAKRIQATVPLL